MNIKVLHLLLILTFFVKTVVAQKINTESQKLNLSEFKLQGVQVVMHNTLAVSEYGLLDQKTLEPRPNYWSALLWNKLMGTKVYDSDLQAEGLDVFVHDLKGSSDGFGVLIVNPKDAESSITVPVQAEQYLLTADSLQSKTIRLNGNVLKLTAGETLPNIKGQKIAAGEVRLPPHSILFLALKNK